MTDPTLDFERFARPHAAAALRLARTLVHDEADAQDVVQDSFLRAFRHFRTFNGDSPRAWLLSIVRNVGLTLWKKRGRDPAVDVDEIEVPDERGPSVETRLVAAADAADLHRCLDQLPLRYREVVVLRELEDCSYREIAAILEVPIGTVMSRLARGRERLVQLLGADRRRWN